MGTGWPASADLLRDPQKRQPLEVVLQRAIQGIKGLEREDRALGALYASIPRQGHPLQEVLEEVSVGHGEEGV